MPSWPVSSMRPMNGLTYLAPALAASMAWFVENISVTFTGMSSEDRRRHAARPSGVMGTFTTTLLPYRRSLRPSSTIASLSVATTSRLTSPFITSDISAIASAGLPPAFASRDGFVVMPSTSPMSLYFLISPMSAVSRNIFISQATSRARLPAAPY